MNEQRGLVISAIDYKEKSKIVYLYTPNGHDSVKANRSKDIKSGLLGFTNSLNYVSYIKTNSKFSTVVEYNVIKSYYDLTESIDKLDVIFKILSVIKEIPQDANHLKIFDFIISILDNLEKTNNSKKILSIFLIKMLWVFGIAPNLKSCIQCGNKNNLISFSIKEASVLCSSCSTKNDKYKIWNEYYYEKKDINSYSDIDFDILLEDIYLYYLYHSHINLKKH